MKLYKITSVGVLKGNRKTVNILAYNEEHACIKLEHLFGGKKRIITYIC